MNNAEHDIEASKCDGVPYPDEKPLILAVDDMPALLSSITKILQEQFTVMAVTSGKAALKVIGTHTPLLFLLDIEMPVIDGYELTAMIRAHEKFKNTPIIFLTAKNSRDDVIAAVRHGGNDYIVKPVNKELLLSKINRYMP